MAKSWEDKLPEWERGKQSYTKHELGIELARNCNHPFQGFCGDWDYYCPAGSSDNCPFNGICCSEITKEDWWLRLGLVFISDEELEDEEFEDDPLPPLPSEAYIIHLNGEVEKWLFQ